MHIKEILTQKSITCNTQANIKEIYTWKDINTDGYADDKIYT